GGGPVPDLEAVFVVSVELACGDHAQVQCGRTDAPHVAHLRQQRGKEFGLHRSPLSRVAETGADERHRYIAYLIAAQGFSTTARVSDVRPETQAGRVHPGGGDVGDRARYRDAVDLSGHGHRIRRDRVHEVHGSVDGIEHPGDSAG